MKTKIFTLSLMLFAVMGFGQNYWTKVNTVPKENVAQRWVQPKKITVYEVNLNQLKNDLSKVPQRFSADESKLITFPGADGTFKKYIVQEASVMEPQLQAKYPDIRSYVGWEQNNKQNSIRFSVTPDNGISAMYFDGWEISYLDNYTKDLSKYIFYKREDLPANDRLFKCDIKELKEQTEADINAKAPLVFDGKFRTYRLALAATGEYTAFHGGTVPKALAAMAVTMTRVNGVYEKTISVTMVMVANNNLIVYTNAATDPYTNNDGVAMLDENTATLNSIIGSANYDIGHVFSTGGGGVAGLGVICTTSKAEGVTGSGAPINDAFDIDYVAHEMGHQFGGNHTFRAGTGSCGGGNVNNATAFEPGSGTTIMAYAGICGVNNVQPNSDAYFHSASVNEMYNVVRRGSDCSVKTANNNQVPTADAGLDYTIPKGTAFVLTGVGTDPDNDPITYLWEQLDNTSNTQPPVATATGGPVYRSLYATVSPSRYFPVMSSVLANNLVPKWEVTPSVARNLNFSLLVNDNRPTGNQAARDLMLVKVDNSGPFVVTSQSTNIQYDAANAITVTWNVAGTNVAPVNTAQVQILLSKDNGANFDVVLATIANNGSASVMLPNLDIASARIMVKAVNNIYYALNSSFFSVKKNLATVDSSTKNIGIYPNPAKHEVNIKMNKSESASYKIYDATGRLVSAGNVSKDGKINVEKLINGNYILNIEMKTGEKLSEKLMIKK